MAQQPLSAAIKNLESELGFDLFDRVANRIHLTAAGGAFLEEARNVLAAADRAVERGRRAARGEVGMFRVGYCSAAMSNVLPSAIASFRQRYPSLALDLRRLDQPEQLAALERNTIDLAFIHRPFDERGLQSLDVLDEALYAALPDTHPLAAYESIEAWQLAALPHVRFAAGSADALRAAADTLFERANVVPAGQEEVNDIDTGLGLVAAGLGACVVNEHVARTQRRPSVAFVPLATDVRVVMAAVWSVRSDESTIRRCFLDLVTATHDTLLVS
jgi:DNA-binding transcriptional LysR family regulator